MIKLITLSNKQKLMSQKFIFVRHCESENNKKLHNPDGSSAKKDDLNEEEIKDWMARDIDPNLTEKGIYQAKLLANYLGKRLEDNKTKNIICHYSPFKRTRQTAESFVKLTEPYSELKLDIVEWSPERKRERLSVLKNHEEFNIDDSWESFLDRAKNYLQSLEDNVRDDSSTIVVFTHSMFISACISIIAVRGTSANFMDINNNILPKSPDDVVFHLSNGSITIFDCQIDINQKKNNPENEFTWRCLSTGYDGYFDYPHKITSGRWW